MVLILFIISAVCFVSLVGIGVAMVRHLRAGQRRERTPAPPVPDFSQHLYAAAEYRPTRAPRQVRHQRVQAIPARKAWNALSQPVEVHPAGADQPVAGRRKSPQPAHAQRADFYFNDNYGDLTDPHPSRPMREASGGGAATGRRA